MHIAENDWFSYKMIYQLIKPHYILEIRNKDSILKQLDSIGVNLKSIYGDYDSIAKYICWKFNQ